MYARSVQPTIMNKLLDKLLAALAAAPTGPLFNTPKLHLLGASVVLNPNMAVAELTPSEAAYTGYAAITLPTAEGPFILLDTVQGLLYDAVFSVGASPVATGTIFGYWIDGNTGADLYLAETFPVGFPMVNTGDFLHMEVLFGLSNLLTVS
jgi:hypothetical protein